MKKISIYLDDNREINYIQSKVPAYYINNCIICRDYFDFTKLVDKHIHEIDFVSFDHDLACFDNNGREWTGKDAVVYLINSCIENNRNFPNWYVHTNNVNGGPNIISYILNYLRVYEGYDKEWWYYNKGIISGNEVK